YVGMLRDLKGPDVFIAALARLRDRGMAHDANIFGDGDDAARYRATVEELGLAGAVTFHGPKPAREAFATGRGLGVPARAESMPYIVLEGAAAAVPMIATNVGGIPEIFAEHTPRLVDPGDAKALAAAMERAAADPRHAASDADALRQTIRSVHAT